MLYYGHRIVWVNDVTYYQVIVRCEHTIWRKMLYTISQKNEGSMLVEELCYHHPLSF